MILQNYFKYSDDFLRFLKSKNININLENRQGITPLMFALIYKKQENIIKLLINEDTLNKIYNNGNSALMYGLKNRNEENIIKLLINEKTDSYQEDNFCRNCLVYALMHRYSENIIRLLIDKKIDINKKYDGKSLLNYALSFKNKENIIKLLINKKTDINQIDNYGNFPLKKK